MKFTGTDNYVATDDLRMAVDAAVALQRPLLIKGEPGTGKTMLAEEMRDNSLRDAVKNVTAISGLPHGKIYKLAIKLDN